MYGKGSKLKDQASTSADQITLFWEEPKSTAQSDTSTKIQQIIDVAKALMANAQQLQLAISPSLSSVDKKRLEDGLTVIKGKLTTANKGLAQLGKENQNPDQIKQAEAIQQFQKTL